MTDPAYRDLKILGTAWLPLFPLRLEEAVLELPRAPIRIPARLNLVRFTAPGIHDALSRDGSAPISRISSSTTCPASI